MGDFASSTSQLNGEEKWAYLEIIWAYWKARHRGEFLKNDKKTLKIIAGISSQKLDKILKFFQVKNDNLFHPRIEQEVEEAIEKYEKSQKRTAPARNVLATKRRSVTDSVPETVTDSVTDSGTEHTITITDQEDKKDLLNNDFDKNVDNFSAKPRSPLISTRSWTVDNFLSEADKNAARRYAPGWDIYELIKIFNNYVGNNEIPDHPAKAFLAWVPKFTKNKPPS